MRHFEVSCKPNWNFPIILCIRVMPTALAKPHFYGIRESTTPTTYQALERFHSTVSHDRFQGLWFILRKVEAALISRFSKCTALENIQYWSKLVNSLSLISIHRRKTIPRCVDSTLFHAIPQ